MHATSYLFPWETLTSIIGGESAIDVPRLHLRSLEEAESFLSCYGYDWQKAAHRREASKIRALAIRFVEEVLLADAPGYEIPAAIRRREDVRRLLLWASAPPTSARQRWSCVLLRVMHTFAHANSNLNSRFGPQVRAQILERFDGHVRALPGGGFQLGDGPWGVRLAHFEVKPPKGLQAAVIKLLHKVENVAASIFDWVGVRFVTQNRFDALLVVRYLRTHNIIMFANVKPRRSRNTLLDMGLLRGLLAGLESEAEQAPERLQARLEALRAEVESWPRSEESGRPYNPFSARTYQSIQFTGRQRIRLPRSLHLEGAEPDELSFFFPFEVQILDQESYEASRSGQASHETYKARQIDAIRKRVLGDLLTRPPTTAHTLDEPYPDAQDFDVYAIQGGPLDPSAEADEVDAELAVTELELPRLALTEVGLPVLALSDRRPQESSSPEAASSAHAGDAAGAARVSGVESAEDAADPPAV